MKKRIVSFILALAMLLSLFPTAAFAAGGDYEVEIAASRFNTVQYNGKDTMKLDFMLKTNNGAKISGIQTALLFVDTSVYDILWYDSGDVSDATEYFCPSNGDTSDYAEGAYSAYSVGTGPNKITATTKMAGETIDGKALFSMQPDFGNKSLSVEESESMMSVLLGLKADAAWDALPSGSVRLATVDEASAFNATGVVTLNDDMGKSYVYRSKTGEADTLTVAPVLSADGFAFADSGDTPETNTEYQVYYEIVGTDSDNDDFVEIEPGATFNVDVYVKSTDSTTKKMQAFDIYPTWNSMLSLVENGVADATGKGIVVSEMTKAVPHFYSVGRELNIDVPATGVKIATMTLKLSADAVYDTHYPVSLADTTNIAIEKNAKSVPVTVDKTAKGAETLKKVTVTFNTNGGSAVAQQTIGYNTVATRPDPNPTKTGYSFENWYSDSELNAAFNFTTKLKTDTTIYAKWTANDVEVTLDPNGGEFAEGAVTSVTEKFEGKYDNALNANQPSRTGYTFAGWSLSNAEDAEVITGETVVAKSEAHTLYAKWTPNNYTIKFDLGGVIITGTAPTDILATYDVEFSLPTVTADPSTGRTFGGWKLDGSTISSPAKNLIAENNGTVTLVAYWTTNSYNITSSATNGTVLALNNEDNSGSANKGDTINVTITESTPGYVLKADSVTYTPENGDPVSINVTKQPNGSYTGTFTMPAANVTVSATFEPINYTVSVDSEITHGTVTIGEGKVDTLENVHVNDTIALNVTPAAGYKVESVTYTSGGVTTDATLSDGKYSFTMPAGDVTVQAVFVPDTYTVTLNANQGKFADNAQTVTIDATYGSTYSNLSSVTAPTRDYYDFAGWFTAAEGGTEVKATDTVNVTSNTTLYAHWTAKSYTIKLVTNGGLIDETTNITNNGDGTYTMTYSYGTTEKLPVTSKDLHTFRNWTVSYAADATEKDGWGEVGATIDEASAIGTYYGNVILTANWDAKFTYEVEDYKYAPEGYVMLRIAAENANNTYVFENGETDINMYFTDDVNYKVGEKFAFVTLIPKNDNVVYDETDGKFHLTTTGSGKVTQTSTAAEVIERNGDVNNDGKINIADANAVYQMLGTNAGNYYPLSHLGILERLEADMDTRTVVETDEPTSEHRGSILDVDEIVTIINNAANPTNP